MNKEKEIQVRTVTDLRDAQKKGKNKFIIMFFSFLIYGVISWFLVFFTNVPDNLGIVGVIYVLIVLLGIIVGPVVSSLLVIIGLNEFVIGPYIPTGLSLSESMRLLLSDLLDEVDNYSKRTEAKNKKKIGIKISRISNRLIFIIEDPLKVGSKFYSKKLDIFTKDLKLFSIQMNRILEEIDNRASSRIDLPNNILRQQFDFMIKKIENEGSDFVYDDSTINNINSLLECLVLPEKEPPKEEVDKFSGLKKVFGYPFVKVLIGTSIVVLVYTGVVNYAKPAITIDTAWLGGITLIGIVVTCIAVYEFKMSTQ
jgi:hypothetical protein